MHILFTDTEKNWIDMGKFGFPIKKGCPDKIKRTIETKKNKLSKQGYLYGNRSNK